MLLAWLPLLPMLMAWLLLAASEASKGGVGPAPTAVDGGGGAAAASAPAIGAAPFPLANGRFWSKSGSWCGGQVVAPLLPPGRRKC